MTIPDWVAVLVAIPGIIAGMAAIPRDSNRPMLLGTCLVFLVMALGLGVFAAVRPSPAASTAQGQHDTASGPGGATATAQGTVSSARPKPDVVRWHGQVTITPSNGLALDTVPPSQGTGVIYDITIGELNQDQVGDSEINTEINIAPWNGSSFPTRQQCADQIDTNPARLITVRSGDIVCVKTQAARIAALKFISVSDNYGPDVAEATVWQLP